MNILITGALSGIGYETGVILASEGHNVYLTTETDNQLETLQKKVDNSTYRNNITCLKLDINNDSDRRQIIDLNLDCLINNAAIGIGGSLIDTDVENFKKTMDTNYFGTLEITKLFIDNYNEGNIVILSSLAGIIPIPFLGSYSATKAALLMEATILHQELLLSKSKIRIKLVEPGLYKTGFNKYMLDYNDSVISKDKYNNIDVMLSFEKSTILFLEKNNISSIAKKVAKATTSKSIKLKYRAPLCQVLAGKLYMLLFK